jgi:hypothetical protein
MRSAMDRLILLVSHGVGRGAGRVAWPVAAVQGPGDYVAVDRGAVISYGHASDAVPWQRPAVLKREPEAR